jgi:uncharacterized protein with PIN domain
MRDQPPRLLADCMLGRLAKWLRLIGYDTAYENVATDPHLARRARAENRVLLTRDRELAERRGLRTLLIRSEILQEQVRQVLESLPLSEAGAQPRCAVCNHALERARPSEIQDAVPPYVLRTHHDFQRCSGCGRVYWPGTHFDAIRRQIAAITPDP